MFLSRRIVYSIRFELKGVQHVAEKLGQNCNVIHLDEFKHWILWWINTQQDPSRRLQSHQAERSVKITSVL